MSNPDYSQAVADILDGLGDSPTPDEVYHAVKNYSVDHVVAASASAAKAGGGGGGGSQAVGCFLEVFPLDLHGAGTKPCEWNHLYDNPTAQNALVAIPAGLGLAFAFDGTVSTITATEDGFWAFTLGFNSPQDATWQGHLALDAAWYVGREIDTVDYTGSSFIESVAEVVQIPTGGAISPSVYTRTDSTANPLNADVYLEIVRLG